MGAGSFTSMPAVRPMAIPVDGGDLAVDLTGPGPASAESVVLLVHDLTGNAAVWQLVTSRLPSTVAAIAVDLRGRGGSADLPGPYGLRWHAIDLAAVLDALDVEVVAVVGHGAGAFVAGLFADRYPRRVRSVVLVDGGVRQRSTVATLGGGRPGRTGQDRFGDDAVLADIDELLDDPDLEPAIERIVAPVELLRAEQGPGPTSPPVIAPEVARALRGTIGHLQIVTVPGVDHQTIVTLPRGADAVAAAIGRAIRAGPAGP